MRIDPVVRRRGQRLSPTVVVQGTLLASFLLLSLLCDGFCAAAVAQARSAPPHSAAVGSSSFQSLAAQANAARDQQDFERAVALYRRATALNPRWAEGWWALGTIYYDSDRYASAADAFRHVVKLNPKHGTARAMLGLCEFELGEDAEALRDIEASKDLGVIEDSQLRQVVVFHEGILLQRAGRFQAAQQALSSLCGSGVRNQQLTDVLGMVILRISDSKSVAPQTADAEAIEHLGRGACLAAGKNYDAAREEYAQVVSRYPHTHYVHYAYGRFLLEAGDRAAAIQEFQQELTEQPANVLAMLQIGAVQYRVDSAGGLPYAEEAVRIAPQAPLAHYVLGHLLLDSGKDGEAITHLEIAKKAFPQDAKIYWSLATAYARVGRQEDAARARAMFARLNESKNTRPDDQAMPLELADHAVPLANQ